MGPFEVAPGTQWLDGRGWKHEMFPPHEVWPQFADKAVRKYPQMGDVSCRSAVTMHRGTAHPSPISRPCWCSAWTPPAPATPPCTT
jgi:hypothetical protein